MAQCSSPVSIWDKKKQQRILVPCGKCLQCMENWQQEWTYRMKQEVRASKNAWFVGLTYNDNWLPKLYRGDKPFHMLLPSDLTRFIKRLRYYSQKVDKDCKIKYFAIGEYGGEENRPHYHLLLLNLPYQDFMHVYELILRSWSYCKKDGNDYVKDEFGYYRDSLGFIKLEYVNNGNMRYLCKYLNKIDPRPHVVKPFRRISKGFGASYINSKTMKYHLSEPFKMYTVESGYKKRLPRYYKDKIFPKKVFTVNVEGFCYPTDYRPRYVGNQVLVKKAEESVERWEKLHPFTNYKTNASEKSDRVLRKIVKKNFKL